MTDSNVRIASTKAAHTVGGSARTTYGRRKNTRSCVARKHQKILNEKRSNGTAVRSAPSVTVLFTIRRVLNALH